MHFDIKGKELELVQDLALEQDITLGDSLARLVRLGHCTKTEEYEEAILPIDTLEGILDRLRNLKVISENMSHEIQVMADEAKNKL